MSGEAFDGTLMMMSWVWLFIVMFGIVVAVLWVALPFAVFGIKAKLDRKIRLQQRTNELLEELLEGRRDVPQDPHT